MYRVLVLTLLVCSVVAAHAEDKLLSDAGETLTEEQTVAIVRKGLIEFRRNMRSENEKTRIEAFDKVMPNKELLRSLFDDDAGILWPQLEKALERMRSNSHRFKDEFDRQGDAVEIELIDVRKKDVSGRYKDVLKAIPNDIPVYRAIVRYKKGAGGSSSYLVVDRKMRFVRGLEEMHRFIREKKAGK